MNDLCEAFLRGASVEEIQSIVESHPSILQMPDVHGKVPLHYACHYQASSSVIDYLCRACPQSLEMATHARQELPLHVACSASQASLEVIQCLVEHSPQALQQASSHNDEDGQLPLHHAIVSHCDYNVVNYLIQQYPKGATTVRDAPGRLAIHMACHVRASLEVIQRLVQLNVHALEIAANDGKLPLHYACCNSNKNNTDIKLVPTRFEVMKLLIDGYSNGCAQADRQGQLPLHSYLMDTKANTDILDYLIQQYPQGLRTRNHADELPIHIALHTKASASIMQVLLERDKEAPLLDPNWLPLHQALWQSVDETVVHLFIDYYPEYIVAQDSQGSTPLHVAINGSWPLDVLTRLMTLASLQIQDVNGRTPLQLAIYCCRFSEILKALMDACPSSLQTPNAQGRLPLHDAIVRQLPDRVTTTLIEKDVQGCQIADEDGNFPLHHAIDQRASLAILQLLLRQYPDAASKANHAGDLPMHRVVRRRASRKVLELLLSYDPKAAQVKDAQGQLPLHLAISCTASIFCIRLLLDAYPQAAMVGNQSGQLPLHLALANGPLTASVVVEALLEGHAKSVIVPDHSGVCPLHLAIQNGSSLGIVQYMMDQYPDSLQASDQEGNIALFWACERDAPLDFVLKLVQRSHVFFAQQYARRNQNTKPELD